MNNSQAWQQNKQNRSDSSRNRDHSGNWVQQKSEDSTETKKMISLKSDKYSNFSNSSLMPPPTPPSLPNFQKRLGGKHNNEKNNSSPIGGNQHQSNYQGNKSGNQRSPMNRPNKMRNSYGGGGFMDRIKDRVNRELSGPQHDLPALETGEKKFNSQCRLFIGNIPRDCDTNQLKEDFAAFGELGQVYFNKESAYGFINFDFKVNAEKAMKEMQGKPVNGRPLTVRFAAVSTGVKVKNLSPFVSNELLEKAFRVFGDIENSRVLVDSRGKPTGEGILIFSEKKGATLAVKKCEEECFFLSSSPRPVVVEPLSVSDEGDGQAEATLSKNEAYRKERDVGPHFGDPQSFEYDYGLRWKQLFYLFTEKQTALEQDFHAECEALETKMSLAKHEYETEQLRRELAAREAETTYLHAEAQYRMNAASFTSFHGSSGATPENYSSNFDSRYNDQFNTSGGGGGGGGGGHFDNSFNRDYNAFDRQNNQSFDNSFNQSSGEQNSFSSSTFDRLDVSNERNVSAQNETTEPTAMEVTTPAATPKLPARLAGRLQDRRDPSEEGNGVSAEPSVVGGDTPIIRGLAHSGSPATTRLGERQTDTPHNTSLEGVVGNSLNRNMNRGNSAGMNRSHNSSGLDRNQGNQPMKRIRY